MNPVLEGIFTYGHYRFENEEIVIHSETSKEQCAFLQELISSNKSKKTLEIGLAYGVSSVAIIESLLGNRGEKHVIIDKFQELHWNNMGLKILKDAGYEKKYTFHEEYCYEALSHYIKEKQVFDFAYIDSTKLFDWILTDFFLLDKLIKPEGVIVFDDVNFPSIRKVLRYVLELPHYELLEQYPANKINRKRQFLQKLIRIIPRYKKIFSQELILTDYDIGISTNCVAIRKVSEDKRPYDWHLPF